MRPQRTFWLKGPWRESTDFHPFVGHTWTGLDPVGDDVATPAGQARMRLITLVPAVACVAILTVAVAAQQPGQDRPARGRGGFGIDAEAMKTLLQKYDKNQDGKIERSEYPRSDAAFANLDRDKSGAIDAADLEARPQRGAQKAGNRDNRPLAAKIPAVGEVAPDFDLPMLGMKDEDGKEVTVKLSSFAGKQPVALIFGSYT